MPSKLRLARCVNFFSIRRYGNIDAAIDDESSCGNLQLGSDDRVFDRDDATETVLRDAKSPKLLVILTQGYLLHWERDRVDLVFNLLKCPEGEESDLISIIRASSRSQVRENIK
jgi:hypothetical protein